MSCVPKLDVAQLILRRGAIALSAFIAIAPRKPTAVGVVVACSQVVFTQTCIKLLSSEQVFVVDIACSRSGIAEGIITSGDRPSPTTPS
jgi:hypothetical protein